MPAGSTGIDFVNEVNDTGASRSFINEFGYMGGGVGIGDFNNDGLKDIFFTGNQVSCRLYINQGNNKFKDITQAAGVTTNVWCTGISIADVNNDGFDDIYVSVFGKDLMHRSKNLLFINQKNLSFKEQATEYGLADSGYSTQAVFADFDRDGDLDMYLVNYLLSSANSNTIYPRDRSGRAVANDRLYRNDRDSGQTGHPHFTDITMQAGIKEDGYGLGVTVSDFNNDQWPDIYVANDFVSNDELWLNNKNGTFTNCISSALRHQSYSSMGADAADINNDGRTDIMTLDMLPEYNERKKTSFSFMNYERYETERSMGYEPEFMRNMLHLNNGVIWHGDTSVPFFSEIGRLSGVSATDWSWSILFADFDNDGWKDIHITNGIGRDFINADFLEFSQALFNSNHTRDEQQQAIREKLASLQHVNLRNYLYINQHDLVFADSSESAGINERSMSNGAAYADLDNDGDLDLVVNNIGKAAFVFLNNTNAPGRQSPAHFLKIKLKGTELNGRAFGSKVLVYSDGMVQLQEQSPVRGYFSCVDQDLVFGLGKSSKVDSLSVIWPDGKLLKLKNIPADSFLVLSAADATTYPAILAPASSFLFTDITATAGAAYRHTENSFNDYNVQRLLPQKFSQMGPFITKGDINGDGMEDFFVGGAFNFSGKFFMQQVQPLFIGKDLTDSIKFEEDMDCILFDADNDGDSDLLVTCGDVQYDEHSVFYKPRLYLNDGAGNFRLDQRAIPDEVKTIAGCVTSGDFDGDGYADLFIGGRVSKKYPLAPRSFILHNDHGVFTDITQDVCPALANVGMVTSAVCTDFDNDKQVDLIVAGEWMPLLFFKNHHGILKETTQSTGLTQMNGMWRSLIATDVDNDGDIDLIAGNLGLNCEYRSGVSGLMQLSAADLDGNGSIDPVFFYNIKGTDEKMHLFPSVSRSKLAEQVPSVKKRFLLNKDYSGATYDDIFKGKAKKDILQLFCDEIRTCWFENTGAGKFVKHALPIEAQFAPVNAIVCDDFDNDGFKDIVLAGNEYQAEIMTGRYDASYGCFLRGSGNKRFTPVTPVESGLILNGDIKDMAIIYTKSREKLLVVAVNNDLLRVFKVKAGGGKK